MQAKYDKVLYNLNLVLKCQTVNDINTSQNDDGSDHGAQNYSQIIAGSLEYLLFDHRRRN